MAEFDAELVDWRELPPGQRRAWWEHLWHGTIALAKRYRLALRASWWEDSIQVEALAAFICWARMYDTGANSDPTGKIQLLWELERLRSLLRAGEEPFDPARDRNQFDRYIATVTLPAPSSDPANPPVGHDRLNTEPRRLAQELNAVERRLAELRERQQLLQPEVAHTERTRGRSGRSGRSQPYSDLCELQNSIEELARRETQLRHHLGTTAQHDDQDEA
jgi:hypothetical protein